MKDIADDHVTVLHRTMRQDPSAFGLYEAARAAGERLTTADIRAPVREGEDFAVRFTVAVGGEGGTIADAAVRRAAAKSARTLVRLHPHVAEGGGGLTGDLFCLLYQLFFADVVGEFLHSVIAEKIKLAVPILHAIDFEGGIADRAADKVLKLVPDPCEETARVADAAQNAEEQVEGAVAAAEDPVAALPEIARHLVPRAVGRVLGLILPEDGDDADADTASVPPLEGGTAA